MWICLSVSDGLPWYCFKTSTTKTKKKKTKKREVENTNVNWRRHNTSLNYLQLNPKYKQNGANPVGCVAAKHAPAAKSHYYCNSLLAKLGLIKPGLGWRLLWPLRTGDRILPSRMEPGWGQGALPRPLWPGWGVRAAPGVPQAPSPLPGPASS